MFSNIIKSPTDPLSITDDFTIGDDLILNSDGATIQFGEDLEVVLRHVHNEGLQLRSATIPTLNFNILDVAVEEDDVVSSISTTASIEASSGDSRLISGSLNFIAEADFTASVNNTAFVVKLGESEAAVEKFRVKADGRTIGKFHHFFNVSGTPSGDATEVFLDFRGGITDAETANVTYARMIMPFAGYLVSYRARGTVASGSSVVRVYKVADGTTADDLDQSGNRMVDAGVTVNMASANTDYEFALGSSSYTFAQGDVIAVSITPSTASGDLDGVLTAVLTTS